MAEWSFKAGKPARPSRPSSQVRVFERSDRDGIYFSRAWRRTESGKPESERLPTGTTRELAEILASETALDREKRILAGDVAEVRVHRLTLDRLLGMYHGSAKAQGWSQGHKRNQDKSRAFWLAVFGAEYPAAALTPGDVEEHARKSAVLHGWGPATERRVLIYIAAAARYAFMKKRALADNPLRGVTPPRTEPETEGLDYSEDEVEALSTPDERIDWRVTLACSIAADTGRRIGAIRHLRTEDVLLREGRFWLRFRKASDKGRKSSTVPVSSETGELVLVALEVERVQRWGWLFPGQRADVPLGGKDATGSGVFGEKLHEAETVLGIPTIEGRAFHGIKRRHVTVSWEESHGDAGLVGDVTGNTSPDVLRKVYRRQSESRKADQVDRVRARFGGRSEPGSEPKKNAKKMRGA